MGKNVPQVIADWSADVPEIQGTYALVFPYVVREPNEEAYFARELSVKAKNVTNHRNVNHGKEQS